MLSTPLHRHEGGSTDPDNLVLRLCRRHHLLWHQGRLQLRDLHAPWLTGPPETGTDPPHQHAA